MFDLPADCRRRYARWKYDRYKAFDCGPDNSER